MSCNPPSVLPLGVPPTLPASVLDGLAPLAAQLDSGQQLPSLDADARAAIATRLVWLHDAGMLTRAELTAAINEGASITQLRRLERRGCRALTRILGGGKGAVAELSFGDELLTLSSGGGPIAVVVPVFAPAFPGNLSDARITFSVAAALACRALVLPQDVFVEYSWGISECDRWLTNTPDAHQKLDSEAYWDSQDGAEFEEFPFLYMSSPDMVAHGLTLLRSQQKQLGRTLGVPVCRRRFGRCSKSFRQSPVGRWVGDGLDLLESLPADHWLHDIEVDKDGLEFERGAVLATDSRLLNLFDQEWDSMTDEYPELRLPYVFADARKVVVGLKQMSNCMAHLHHYPRISE